MQLRFIEQQVVRLVLAHQSVEHGGKFGDGHNSGHGRTALEGVQGPLQGVVYRDAVLGICQEPVEAGQVALGLATEDVQ